MHVFKNRFVKSPSSQPLWMFADIFGETTL